MLLVYYYLLKVSSLVLFSSAVFSPLSPRDPLKHHFTSLKTDLIFQQLGVFRSKISIKLVRQYMVIFFNFPLISNHLHPLQVENCDSNLRFVVEEDDHGNFRLESVNFSFSFP